MKRDERRRWSCVGTILGALAACSSMAQDAPAQEPRSPIRRFDPLMKGAGLATDVDPPPDFVQQSRPRARTERRSRRSRRPPSRRGRSRRPRNWKRWTAISKPWPSATTPCAPPFRLPPRPSPQAAAAKKAKSKRADSRRQRRSRPRARRRFRFAARFPAMLTDSTPRPPRRRVEKGNSSRCPNSTACGACRLTSSSRSTSSRPRPAPPGRTSSISAWAIRTCRRPSTSSTNWSRRSASRAPIAIRPPRASPA